MSEFPNKDTQFKPGESGNPAGAPPRRPMASALKKLLNENDGADLQAIVTKAISLAKEGDYRWGKEILDRIDGKVADKIEHSGRVDSLITQERFEDMDNDRKARFLRTAGVTDVLTPGDGEDTGAVETGGV